jgi:hypothetical protein
LLRAKLAKLVASPLSFLTVRVKDGPQAISFSGGRDIGGCYLYVHPQPLGPAERALLAKWGPFAKNRSQVGQSFAYRAWFATDDLEEAVDTAQRILHELFYVHGSATLEVQDDPVGEFAQTLSPHDLQSPSSPTRDVVLPGAPGEISSRILPGAADPESGPAAGQVWAKADSGARPPVQPESPLMVVETHALAIWGALPLPATGSALVETITPCTLLAEVPVETASLRSLEATAPPLVPDAAAAVTPGEIPDEAPPVTFAALGAPEGGSLDASMPASSEDALLGMSRVEAPAEIAPPSPAAEAVTPFVPEDPPSAALTAAAAAEPSIGVGASNHVSAPQTPSVEEATPSVTPGDAAADAASPVFMPIIIIVINHPTSAAPEEATTIRAAEPAHADAAPSAPPVDAPVEVATPPIATVEVPIEDAIPGGSLAEAPTGGPGEHVATALVDDLPPPPASEVRRVDAA